MRNRRRRKRFYRFLKLVLGIFFLVLIFTQFTNLYKGFSGLVSPAVRGIQNKSLRLTVEKASAGTEGNYAVFIKNLKTGESYFKDENKIFESASLYKLWVMAEVFRRIQEGELKEDDELSGDIAVLNRKFNISSESAELTSGGLTLTVKSALNQMITISHNYAALLLSERIKLSSVAKFLSDNGFNESRVGIEGDTPQTTAFDMALFLEKLYKGELDNEESTTAMIDLLKKQQLNNKLPKKLPEGTEIAHKTGELGYLSHDAGIVFTDKGDYIIVVLSESDYPPGAEERIADLSKAVYEYFTN